MICYSLSTHKSADIWVTNQGNMFLPRLLYIMNSAFPMEDKIILYKALHIYYDSQMEFG